MEAAGFAGCVCAVLLASSLAVAGAGSAVAGGPPARPKAPTSLETTARGLVVEPRDIVLSQDGDAAVWGPASTGFAGAAHWPHEPAIRWTRWGARSAAAEGALVQGDCTPNCSRGRFTAYPVSIRMWRPAVVHGERIFTRFAYVFTSHRPAGAARRVVSTAHYLPATAGSPASWGWVPSP